MTNFYDNIENQVLYDENGQVEVIGVSFKPSGKVYYFSPQGIVVNKGNHVIVETARGIEYGFVNVPNKIVEGKEIIPPLRAVLRIATEEDEKTYVEIKEKEINALKICLEKVSAHGLEMKVIEAEYTFDMTKLTFYFTADGRIDFRELVKNLASTFKTRIELHQIGIRDEAKLVGGLGCCGRPFCCSTFLPDFNQVSIKMAKEQNLSLNSSKISGTCGRLMCCLKFEHEAYQYEISQTPPVDSVVKTPNGVGKVVEINPIRGLVKVSIDEAIHQYHRDDLKVLSVGSYDDKDDYDEPFDIEDN